MRLRKVEHVWSHDVVVIENDRFKNDYIGNEHLDFNMDDW